MSNLFRYENAEEAIEKIVPKKSHHNIDDYLNIEFSTVSYSELDLDELEKCEALNRFIKSAGFEFEYNSRDYLFMIDYQRFGKNKACLVQYNNSKPTDLSEADFQYLINMFVEMYSPSLPVSIEDHKPEGGKGTDFIVHFQGINVKGQPDIQSFRDDIEQYFKPNLRYIKNIQVDFIKIKFQKIVSAKLNPNKLSVIKN